MTQTDPTTDYPNPAPTAPAPGQGPEPANQPASPDDPGVQNPSHDTNPNATPETTGTNTGTGEASGTARKQHAKPVFDLRSVGAELPIVKQNRTAPAGVTREARFKDNLTAIQADPGNWYMLADYGAPTTARRTAKILTEAVNAPYETHGKDGEVITHGGEMQDLVADGAGTYEFVGQRSEEDATRSKLFARYVARQ